MTLEWRSNNRSDQCIRWIARDRPAGFTVSIFRSCPLSVLRHKARKHPRRDASRAAPWCERMMALLPTTMRDQSTILFTPACSIEPQSSVRSDCMDKSSRNSRIVTRSIFGSPVPFPLRQPWRWIRGIRIQFAIGLTAKKAENVSRSGIFCRIVVRIPWSLYPEIDRPLDHFVQFNFPQVAVALP